MLSNPHWGTWEVEFSLFKMIWGQVRGMSSDKVITNLTY